MSTRIPLNFLSLSLSLCLSLPLSPSLPPSLFLVQDKTQSNHSSTVAVDINCSYLPTYLPTHLPTYLPTHPPILKPFINQFPTTGGGARRKSLTVRLLPYGYLRSQSSTSSTTAFDLVERKARLSSCSRNRHTKRGFCIISPRTDSSYRVCALSHLPKLQKILHGDFSSSTQIKPRHSSKVWDTTESQRALQNSTTSPPPNLDDDEQGPLACIAPHSSTPLLPDWRHGLVGRAG